MPRQSRQTTEKSSPTIHVMVLMAEPLNGEHFEEKKRYEELKTTGTWKCRYDIQ